MKFLAVLLALVVATQGATPVITNMVVQGPTAGNCDVTVFVNPGGERTTLRLTWDPADPVNGFREDANVPVINEVTERPFSVFGLEGGRTYTFVAEVLHNNGANPPTPYDPPIRFTYSEPIVVAPYSKITLKDPVVTPATDGNPPKAVLTATAVASGGTISKVTFKYGTASGTYTGSAEGLRQGTTDDYKATINPTGADTLRRGILYFYQVEVEVSGSSEISKSEEKTFVVPENRAPVAKDDSFTLLKDGSLILDVRKNDSDPDGDELTIVKITQGKQGKVEILPGGLQLKYTPIPDATGGDTFTYTIRDAYEDTATEAKESKTDTATVTIVAPGLKTRGWHAAEIKDDEGNVVGIVRLYGTGTGSISGKVQMHSKTYSVFGQVDANGNFYFTIPRDGDPLQLNVNFLDEESDFKATLSSDDGEWTADAGEYALSDVRRDEIVGKYTLEFPAPGGDGNDLPQGTGFARLDVKPWGEVSWKGRLNDGTKFSGSGVLTGNDTAASVSFWVTPDESRVYTKLSFSNANGATVTGETKWFRDADSGADFFPNGFYVEMTPNGSPYDPPKDNRSLEGAKKATLALTNGNLVNSIEQAIEISKSDRANFLNSNPYVKSLKIDSEDGTFEGRFDHPFDNSSHTFRGVILQTQGKGSGVFTGIDQTGTVTLTIGLPDPPPAPPPPPPNPNPNPNPP